MKYLIGKQIILCLLALLLSADALAAVVTAEQGNNAATDLQQLQQIQQAANKNATTEMQTSLDNARVQGGTFAAQQPLQPTTLQPPAGLQQNPMQQLLIPPPSDPAPVPLNPNANSAVPQIPETPEEQAIREAAFQGVVKSTLPMTTEQIVRLRQLFAQSQLAASTLPWTPPRPVATSQMVNLSPGSIPPVVRLQQGFVSSLVFLDSTGAPWPIEAYDVGNPTAFNIQWNHTDNTLMIQPSSLYTSGNLAVRLKGLVTPVMLTLIPGQQAVDYRVDMRVQGLGPNATALPSGDGLPSPTSQELLGVLDGVPPPGSRMLKVLGGDAQAWLFNDTLYLRTRLTVLSPSWLATMSSADGMKAYELQKTPMLLASQNGKAIHVKIEGI